MIPEDNFSRISKNNGQINRFNKKNKENSNKNTNKIYMQDKLNN